MEAESEQERVLGRQFKALVALIVTAMGCAMLVLATPRAIVPSELPPLVLDRGRVQSAIAADARLAEGAPGGMDVDQLEARYLEEGIAERGGVEEMGDAQARQYGTRALARRVFARVGAAGVQGLRASAVLRFMRALAGETRDEHEVAGVLGKLPELLRTYGLLDEQGRVLAPELSVRVMAKARWNLVHGLSASAGMSAIEIQAFEGFIALHAGAAPKERRAEAARSFYAAGGQRGAQAYATWLFHGGRVKDALTMLERAHAYRPELSTRNFAIGVLAPPL